MIKKIFTGTLIDFFSKILGLFLISLFGLSGTAKITTGDFLYFFKKLNFSTWILIILAVLFLLIFIRRLTLKYQEWNYLPMIYFPREEKQIGSHLYDGVIWRVKYPLQQNYSRKKDTFIDPSLIIIDPNPLCPKCHTKLKRSRTIWCGHKWECPRRDFKKWKLENNHYVARDVESIVRSNVEREIEINKMVDEYSNDF